MIFGKGVNDVRYKVTRKSKNKQEMCPYYRRWRNMLERCYSARYHEIYPTYSDVFVCDDWLLFSNFRKWMISQDWKGKELDKDILFPNNKEYSPDRCIFVSHELNKLLTNHENGRGKYPQGVHEDKRYNNFVASISIKGKQQEIGRYKKVEDAREAYINYKYNHILKIIDDENDLRIKSGLFRQLERVNF